MKSFYVAALMLLASCSTAAQPEQLSSAEYQDSQLATAKRIPELMEAFGISGLAVTAVAGDQVLVEQGFGETVEGQAFTSQTPCGLFSATKVLASLAYSQLNDQNILNLDAPLGSYITDAPSEWQGIPFFRLLNHSSGIAMAVTRKEFEDLASDPGSTNASVYQLVRNEPLDFAPGSASRYRQSGYAIGEMILQDRLDTDFAALVSDTITVPAGMTSTNHPATDDPTSAPILLSAGGYMTTAADMARLFLALNAGKVISPQAWKDTLLHDAYLVGDYSLGSVIEYDNGVLTIGHSGGGARANIRYAPDKAIGAMICTDDRGNNGLAIELARMLIQEIASGVTPPLPMLVAAPTYPEMTAEQVIDAVQIAESQGERYDLKRIEPFLNEVGYTFLDQERHSEAVKVLAFNAERFPTSQNAHDSLGEALLASGDIEAALARYRQVLKLDPDNAHASKMVEGILARLDERLP
jgi:CubicO group peptidase (beta-lactamase class C family)